MAASLKFVYLFLSLFTVIDGTPLTDDQLNTLINERKALLKAEMKEVGDRGKDSNFLPILTAPTTSSLTVKCDIANAADLKTQCEDLAKVLAHVYKKEWEIRKATTPQADKVATLATFYTGTTEEDGVNRKILSLSLLADGDAKANNAKTLAAAIQNLTLVNDAKNVADLVKIIKNASEHLETTMQIVKTDAIAAPTEVSFLEALQRGTTCIKVEVSVAPTELQSQCTLLSVLLKDVYNEAKLKPQGERKTFYDTLPNRIARVARGSTPKDDFDGEKKTTNTQSLVDELKKLVEGGGGGIPTWVWWLVGLGVVLLIVIAAVVIVQKKKGGKKGKKTGENDPIANK